MVPMTHAMDRQRTRPPLFPSHHRRELLWRRPSTTASHPKRTLRALDTLPILASCHLPDGSNAFCNQRWHDYTGLSPEEAHGWGWTVPIHPEDLEKLMDTWSHFLASGEPGEEEARLRRFDGAYRWFLFVRCRFATSWDTS